MIIKEPVSNPYYDSTSKFVIEILQQNHAIAVNNFSKKYKSYADTIKGNKSNEKGREKNEKSGNIIIKLLLKIIKEIMIY